MRQRGTAAELLRAATRRQTAPGQLREVASLAITAAMWPFGRVDRGVHDLRRHLEPERGMCSTPVLLVHGYGANKSNWWFLERELRTAGFGVIHALNYNPLLVDVPTVAARCVRRARELMRETGSDHVHLVGHSLGGIIVRYAVQLGGLTEAATCITIASPHAGAPLAALGVGRLAAQVRGGSPLLRRLSAASRMTSTRFTAYYSNLDLLVPGWRAMISEPALRATNILVKDEGHLSIMLSRRLADSVATQLAAAEGLPGYGRPLVTAEFGEPTRSLADPIGGDAAERTA
jgi:pimeloyl-ACP methyl ester carboxylesterase